MDQSFIIANRTDVGKVREVNEDSMVTFDSPNGRVVAVCDGMGGQAAGDVASRLACDIITDILTNNKFSTPTEAITKACMAANQGIVHKAAQNPNLEGMGATCVMVIIKDGLVYYGWVGDSRIYYISKDKIIQLTRDQSYVQQLVDQGQITASEAENHPQKNQILNALGLPQMTPPQLCSAPLTPESGSVVLLCSDGLTGMVDNNQILSIVSEPKVSLQRKADLLVERALENGGSDNITVQLIHFGKEGAVNKFGENIREGNKIGMWALIGAAVVIVAILFVWLFTGNNDEPENVATTPPVIEQKESPSSSTKKTQTTSTEKKVTTTTVSKQAPKTQPQPQPKKDEKTKQTPQIPKKENKKEKDQTPTFGKKTKGNEDATGKINEVAPKHQENEGKSKLDEMINKDK